MQLLIMFILVISHLFTSSIQHDLQCSWPIETYHLSMYLQISLIPNIHHFVATLIPRRNQLTTKSSIMPRRKPQDGYLLILNKISLSYMISGKYLISINALVLLILPRRRYVKILTIVRSVRQLRKPKRKSKMMHLMSIWPKYLRLKNQSHPASRMLPLRSPNLRPKLQLLSNLKCRLLMLLQKYRNQRNMTNPLTRSF